MKIAKPLLFIAFLLLNSLFIYAQSSKLIIENYITSNKEKLSLSINDVVEWTISSEYETQHNQITHAHVQQKYNDIEIFNAISNFTIDKDGNVLMVGNRLVNDASRKVNSTTIVLNETSALSKAMAYMSLYEIDLLKTYSKIIYYPLEDLSELRLGYYIELFTNDEQHVWSVIVDGMNGTVLKHWDQVLHCSFGHGGFESGEEHVHQRVEQSQIFEDDVARRAGAYGVFAIPTESPNHGSQSIVTDPEYLPASPFGWHDTNGAEGAEYTITRGNNVHAYEDSGNNDAPGYSPDGGAGLNFIYSYFEDVPAVNNQDAAITNLFYMCNTVHDVLYAYGFDEAAGNFQFNNYGNGGAGSDEVEAEGLDGSGLNNANFFTPSDGQNPAMQMYLWNGGGPSEYLFINDPSIIAGGYSTTDANFGPPIPTEPLTADVVLYDDGVNPINDACEDPINGAALNGKIAIIDRGDCLFVEKVIKAQDAGAVAVIIVNNVSGSPITMGGGDENITIPSVMVSMIDGAGMKSQILNGTTVNATLVDSSGGVTTLLDGDFDNGIITHEYGHGISTRLVGGRNNSNCLFNNEQMGEGWSDWYGAMLTMDMAVENPVYRPIGTFVTREDPATGFGIRPAPYDTSFSVNDYTYADLGDVAVPHGVGFVWATMLWDLTWALMDEYGYDPDLLEGTGGNNIAMTLVTDGLKMTACGPGFVDGRNAILNADEVNYEGANKCLIWEVFARRGLGLSAQQGLSFSNEDGTAAFDLPAFCDTDVLADFDAVDILSCDGFVQFTDASEGNPSDWDWDFGDGNSSSEVSPSHTYQEAGIYTVTLTVSNETSTDDEVKTDYVQVVFLEAPTGTSDIEGCVDESATLTAISENTLNWYDENDNLLFSGDPFVTPALTGSTTYFVADAFTLGNETCESDKVPLSVTTAEALFTFNANSLTVTFTDNSINASSWSWEFGDGENSEEQNPTYTYPEPGIYEVELSINNKMCAIILSVDLSAVGVNELYSNAGVDIMPNPAENYSTLSSTIKFPSDAIVQIIGVDGRVVQETQIKYETNVVNLELKSIPNGFYSVLVSLNDELLTQKKLVISRQ